MLRRLLVFVMMVALFAATVTHGGVSESGIDLSKLTPEQIQALQKQLNALATSESSAITDVSILQSMADLGAPIDLAALTTYDEFTDPNKLIGTPGGYSYKTDFGCVGYADNLDGNAVGGTIEVYADDTGAKKRFNYLNGIYTSSPILADMRVYYRGAVVIRVSDALDDADVAQIKAAFESVVPGTTEAYGDIVPDASAAPAVTSEKMQAIAEGNVYTADEFVTISKGDNGPEVTKMQTRLKELGFLSDVADGMFGGNTEKAVMQFQETNDLLVTGYATPEDQVVLFNTGVISASGKTFARFDPYAVCPVEISTVKVKSSYGTPYITFTVQNTSTGTIVAFEYEIKFFDGFGDRLTGYNNNGYTHSYSEKITSGERISVSTKDDYEMFDFVGVEVASVAIVRIKTLDGIDITYDDPIWVEGK